MYPIKLFKCFLIIVLCTFTALQSIPSSISSFIGRLKYWSLTDKSKHYNLAPERERDRVRERERAAAAALLECTWDSSSLQTLFALLRFFVNRICLPWCSCKAPARWWAVDMTIFLSLVYLYPTHIPSLSSSTPPLRLPRPPSNPTLPPRHFAELSGGAAEVLSMIATA